MVVTEMKIVSEANGKLVLERACPFCGNAHRIEVDSEVFSNGMKKYNAGSVVQNAFPSFTQNEREFIVSGICQMCWDNI